MLSIEERAAIVIEEAWSLLPDAKQDAWISSIELDDLQSKHGSYAPDEGKITLSTRLFWGRDAAEVPYIDIHGNTPAQCEPYSSRALHTIIHECFHAIGHATGADRAPAWLALGGWEESWEDRHTTGRYYERRPGWEEGFSEWAYRKGTWFPRDYSRRSPYECFADCGTHIALGWHGGITSANGRAQVRYMLREVWGQTSRARIDAAMQGWRRRLVVSGG